MRRRARAGEPARPRGDASRTSGPPGTFSEEALLASARSPAATSSRSRSRPSTTSSWPCRSGEAERGVVPIENSIEGSVDATLDALAGDAPDVCIVGEVVLPGAPRADRRAPGSALDAIEVVVSHPQALAQCARVPARRAAGRAAVRVDVDRRGGARRRPSAPRDGGRRSARSAPRSCTAATVVRDGIEDVDGERDALRLARAAGHRRRVAAAAPKTSLVFSGRRRRRAGLARALPVGVRVPRREPHADRVAPAQGPARRLHVLRRPRGRRRPTSGSPEAVEGLRAHCEQVRVLGSYPAA